MIFRGCGDKFTGSLRPRRLERGGLAKRSKSQLGQELAERNANFWLFLAPPRCIHKD